MSLKSCARRRPRTFARIMPKPPSNAVTPRAAVELLARLTTLSQELAGAFRPATVVEVVARTLGEILQPDRLCVILLDAETNRLAVTHDTNPVPARTDDPLLQLALRRGPLAFPRNVQEEARRRGADLTDPPPGSWIGAPLVAAGRAVGAVSLASDRQGVLGEAELTLVAAVLAQAAIALENARLVELLSSAKREWEKTVDAITQAICIVDAHGMVRRANRVFAELIQVPVTAIPGRPWIGLLPPAWSNPVARALAEPTATLIEIRQEAERAATIVKNLLSFARSQEGERTLQPIGLILESTLALLRNQLMANKVEATLEVEPGLPDVEVDGNQIKQVFVNLINNANQAIASDAPSGRIWVAAKPQRAGAGVAVSITDSGPGMAEEIAAHVFEPFFTTKGEGEGTGLGLSICQGILTAHGGRPTLH